MAVDGLRGLIMILMALDHANFFVAQKHSPGEYWGGPFPVYHHPIPFLARLVTHLSAPGFFFLMGAGMGLFKESRRARGWSPWRIKAHFWIRGAMLIALQFLVVNRAWELSPGGWPIQRYIGVLAALGAGMILGSMTLWVQPPTLLALASLLFLSTELAVPGPDAWGSFGSKDELGVLNLIFMLAGGDLQLWSNYPLLPWFSLVLCGLAFAPWLRKKPEEAVNQAWKIGTALLLLFLLLRGLDGFGNLRPRVGDGWMGFLNVVKYPPSMTFITLTMGINLVILWSLERVSHRLEGLVEVLAAFGRVPLFFYVLHLFLYLGLALAFTPGGSSIPAMLPFWLLGLLLLYPLCIWFGDYKQRKSIDALVRFV